MLKWAIVACGLLVALGGVAIPAGAQQPATLVLRSGERLSGLLVDMGGVGFTVQVGGQNRQIATNDVLAIEFTAGGPTAEARTRLRAGQPLVVLRSGQIVEGRLNDLGGTTPLRVSIDTASGPRDFTSNDIAQIYLAYSPSFEPAAPRSGPRPDGTISVRADEPWVRTGTMVRGGDRVTFRATGDIMAGPGASAGPAGSPIMKSPNYPVPDALGAALIAKVGNDGRAFFVGSNTNPIAMPADGELFLGVNDDGFDDNTGAFTVTVTPQAAEGAIRRR